MTKAASSRYATMKNAKRKYGKDNWQCQLIYVVHVRFILPCHVMYNEVYAEMVEEFDIGSFGGYYCFLRIFESIFTWFLEAN